MGCLPVRMEIHLICSIGELRVRSSHGANLRRFRTYCPRVSFYSLYHVIFSGDRSRGSDMQSGVKCDHPGRRSAQGQGMLREESSTELSSRCSCYSAAAWEVIMIRKSMTIALKDGLEARPIAELVQVASKYDSRIYIELGTKRVNAKSIMGMMSLELDNGDEMTVSADGADEEPAIADIETYVTTGRGSR